MIEVVVASALLVLGVLATLALMDRGASATATSLQKDRATAIAEELVERAQGMTYSVLVNQMVEPDATTGDSPGRRIQQAMSPDSASVTAPTDTINSTYIGRRTSTWQLQRGGTTYTVSYRACTHSDVVDHVQILGPYDCDRVATGSGGGSGGSGGGSSTPTACASALLTSSADIASQIQSGTPAANVVARVQLLGVLGVNACVGGILNAVGLGNLLNPVCQLLGNGTNALSSVNGLLNGVLGTLGSQAQVSVCPSTPGSTSSNLPYHIGSSTDVEVTVTWTPPGRTTPVRVVQSALVRRAAA
jgi:Tfp pilus assembly protein PilV